jgi:hypothetical protein
MENCFSLLSIGIFSRSLDLSFRCQSTQYYISCSLDHDDTNLPPISPSQTPEREKEIATSRHPLKGYLERIEMEKKNKKEE